MKRETVTVCNGPYDGLRLTARFMDDGTAKVEGAEIFMPEGLDDYFLDTDTMELVHRNWIGGN